MTISLPFRDRQDAANRLALALAKYRGTSPVVAGIPRGGVPMAKLIAGALGGELDVVLVRKLGAPGHEEYAIGSVDEQGNVVLNEAAWTAGADEAYAREAATRELQLIVRRRAQYSPDKPAVPVRDRIVIVVDDGLATGATMLAALKALRRQAPRTLVCAVPVAASDSLTQVRKVADEVICLATPPNFRAVSLYYQDFSPVGDEEVIAALASTPAAPARKREAELDPFDESFRHVRIPAGSVTLEGDLTLPPRASGLVIFAHGSGSSRSSARNRYVAQALNHRGFGTLLFDLLTPEEDQSRASRFDIALLARRLDTALVWAQGEPALRKLPVGLFGASTGAAAALIAAADRPSAVATVVSRGGRPDLAGVRALAIIDRPVLLIVGGFDEQVLELNHMAASTMRRTHAEIAVVPGATHLFEEPGTLQQAASLAAGWFERWLSGHGVAANTRVASAARASAPPR